MKPFKNRLDAGEKLIPLVKGLDNPLIVALPRGGLPLAQIISDRLSLDRDVCLVRKIASPENPEFALGAIGEEGVIEIEEGGAGIEMVIEKERQEIKRQKKMFVSGSRPIIQGRDVVVVDDGLATGRTAIVAGEVMKRKGARKIIGAFPVGSPRAKKLLEEGPYDEVRFIVEDPALSFVGNYYDDFRHIEDKEALQYI